VDWSWVARTLAATAVAAAAWSLTGFLRGGAAGERLLQRLTVADRGPGGRSGARAASPGAASFPTATGGPRAPVPAWAGVLRSLAPAGLGRRFGPPDAETAAALASRGLDAADVHLGGCVLGLGLALLLGGASLAGGHGSSPWPLVAAAGLGWLGPRVWLGRAAALHRAEVARELPRVTELLALAAESGLELPAALEMALSHSDGPVGRAFLEALAEVRAGREMGAALRAAGDRLGTGPARSLVDAVVRGLELGTPVVRVLQAQAESLRVGRRQALEARIAALSMKLTLATVALFVPALLVLSVLPNLMAFLQGKW